MKNPSFEQLWNLVEPLARAQGYELADIEWRREIEGWVLRVFIDVVPGADPSKTGVTHDDCTQVSRELSALLDVEDCIQVAYSLEVSSPGLNRPLRRENDFRRFVGKKAKIRTRTPVPTPGVSAAQSTGDGGRRNFSGTLVAVEDGRVRIDVGDQTFDVPVAEVEKANLVYEF